MPSKTTIAHSKKSCRDGYRYFSDSSSIETKWWVYNTSNLFTYHILCVDLPLLSNTIFLYFNFIVAKSNKSEQKINNTNCELTGLPHETSYKLIHSKTVVASSIDSLSVPTKRKSDNFQERSLKKTNRQVDIGFDPYRLENIDFGSRAYGIFNQYPTGILNPAFCGMILWELTPHHLLNEFRINQYHQIRSGVILQNSTAYVFTPICNDDIHSHLKILIRNKSLKNNIPPSTAATMLRKYVRYNSESEIIPMYQWHTK